MQLARQASERDPAFPQVLFVGIGDIDAATSFFADAWPGARAICDPALALYAAFGLTRAPLSAVIGPAVWKSALRAWRHGVGAPTGDVRMLSGTFLLGVSVHGGHDAQILWEHRAAHAGDVPDFAAAARAAASRDQR